MSKISYLINFVLKPMLMWNLIFRKNFAVQSITLEISVFFGLQLFIRCFFSFCPLFGRQKKVFLRQRKWKMFLSVRPNCWICHRNRFFQIFLDKKSYKTGVINDPLGQTHSLGSSTWTLFSLEICFVLLDFENYGRTACAKTMITIGSDCGSAEWINN